MAGGNPHPPPSAVLVTILKEKRRGANVTAGDVEGSPQWSRTGDVSGEGRLDFQKNN